jgi:uncharacterized protein YhaN
MICDAFLRVFADEERKPVVVDDTFEKFDEDCKFSMP